jgi:glucose/arabinose dehydrogenase
MKTLFTSFSIVVFSFIGYSQGVYLDPAPTDANEPARLYVDISSAECNCPELLDADPQDNPLYIWTWNPNENRPDVIIEGNPFNVMNGMWSDSNENLKMIRDENDPNLWYYDFLGTSLADFYDVPASVLYDEGIDFLIKEKNGAPPNMPEQKSPDLSVNVIIGIEIFEIDYETILSGITAATTITHAGDERIFLTEKPGTIRIFYRDGTLEENPFMDIQDRVQDIGGEQGLLGLAFEPDFCESGRFYVNYTANDGGLVSRISRFTLDSENPSIGDPNSEEILIQFDQDFGNHNGGHIEFGPDGYLYIGTGDGGAGGDPNNRAQDITSLLGKMLRIDVSPETGYEIPADNPYIFDDFGQDEIWSYGWRNPWKFAFDREFGDLYIADVGQNAFEEVNFEAVDAPGGLNYGWRCYEGNSEFNTNDCEASSYVFPIAEYPHNNGNCSVTGGRVYRGPSFEAFDGWFFYTDYCSGLSWAVTQIGDNTFIQEFGSIGETFITTFGEDVWGEIYFSNGGDVHRLLDPNDELIDPIIQNGLTLSSTFEGDSYQWVFDGEEVGTENELEISETGEYTLIIDTENGCQIEASIDVVSLSADFFENSKNLLKIFPNPAMESITVDRGDYRNAHNLNIVTIDGRLVRSFLVNSNLLEIDLNSLDNGVYILDLRDETGNSIAQSKMIKQ